MIRTLTIVARLRPGAARRLRRLHPAHLTLRTTVEVGASTTVLQRSVRLRRPASGFGSSDTTVTRAITNAIARGVIFVTITHNDGVGTIRFPGSLTNCITVGATDEADSRFWKRGWVSPERQEVFVGKSSVFGSRATYRERVLVEATFE